MRPRSFSVDFKTKSKGTAKHFELTKLPIKQKAQEQHSYSATCLPSWVHPESRLSLPSWVYDTSCHYSWHLSLKSTPKVSTPQSAHTALCATNEVEDLTREMCTLAWLSTGLPLSKLCAASVVMAPTYVQNMTLVSGLKILNFMKKSWSPQCFLLKITSN